MIQGKKVVFVANCILNQNMRARGVKKSGSGAVKEVVDEFLKSGIGIVQIPCPEFGYEGLHRFACGKKRYDVPDYRKICGEIAGHVLEEMEAYRTSGVQVLGVLGLNGSPSCAVDFCSLGGGKWGNEPGIFIEELKRKLGSRGMKQPLVGANVMRMNQTIVKIRLDMLKRQENRKPSEH